MKMDEETNYPDDAMREQVREAQDEYLKTIPATQLKIDRIDYEYYLGVAFGLAYGLTVLALIVTGIVKNSTPVELAAVALVLVPRSGLFSR